MNMTHRELFANSKLLVAGGALGDLIADQAAQEGVPDLIIVTDGVVDQGMLSWPQFTTRDVGRVRAEVIAERLRTHSRQCVVHVEPRYPLAADWPALVTRSTIVVNAIDPDSRHFLELARAGRAGDKPVLVPLTLEWIGALLVFTPESPPLDDFLGLGGTTMLHPAWPIGKRLMERVAARLPESARQMNESVRRALAGEPRERPGDFWLPAAALASGALAVQAMAMLASGRPVRTAPDLILVDLTAAVGGSQGQI